MKEAFEQFFKEGFQQDKYPEYKLLRAPKNASYYAHAALIDPQTYDAFLIMDKYYYSKIEILLSARYNIYGEFWRGEFGCLIIILIYNEKSV
jgi:hypothetical protein